MVAANDFRRRRAWDQYGTDDHIRAGQFLFDASGCRRTCPDTALEQLIKGAQARNRP